MRASEKLFVDYAGQTVPIVGRRTGEILFEAEIFVAVMGASNYSYAEATRMQTLPDWIGSHIRAFAFFGGVPEILVPDRWVNDYEKIRSEGMKGSENRHWSARESSI